MSDDLVKRLRDARDEYYSNGDGLWRELTEAADEIERLEKEVADITLIGSKERIELYGQIRMLREALQTAAAHFQLDRTNAMGLGEEQQAEMYAGLQRLMEAALSFPGGLPDVPEHPDNRLARGSK